MTPAEAAAIAAALQRHHGQSAEAFVLATIRHFESRHLSGAAEVWRLVLAALLGDQRDSGDADPP